MRCTPSTWTLPAQSSAEVVQRGKKPWEPGSPHLRVSSSPLLGPMVKVQNGKSPTNRTLETVDKFYFQQSV